MRRFPWAFLLALLAGLGVGLLISWLIAPVHFVDTTPNTLRADFKDQMRSAVAASYAASGNLERARARLAQLDGANSIQALSAQAQQMLAAGETSAQIQQIAQLTADLQQPPTESVVAATTPPTSTSTTIPPSVTVSAPQPGLTETIIPEQVIEPPATVSTPTPRPTRTPTSTPGKAFELIAQDTLCQVELQDGLLQVVVTDAHRRQIAGVEIIVTWDGGEERFFTGFKPELGNGYADFVMQAGTVYSVRVTLNGTPVSSVSPPACTANDGATFTGAIRLSFQQP
jgi:hypothetical protein